MPDAIPFPQAARHLERRRIINDTSIRSIKPPVTGAVDYFDDLTPGLSLRITSKDVRTWTVFYRDKHARQKRLSLGRYPSVKLVDARELAHAAQRSAAKGGDPVVDKRAARDVLTFAELAKTYMDDYAKPRKKSWAEDQRHIDADLLPRWRSRPAGEIHAEDLLAILNAKVRAGSPIAANRVRALVSRMYTFAAEQRLVPPTANPVTTSRSQPGRRHATAFSPTRRSAGCGRPAKPRTPTSARGFGCAWSRRSGAASYCRCGGRTSIRNRTSGPFPPNSSRTPTAIVCI